MRKVIFLINTSLDGFTAGPNGDLSWLIPQAVTEESYRHFKDIRNKVDTVLLGRLNYEGFRSYWPTVSQNPASAKKDVEFSRWLDNVEKVVFSRTLKKVDWVNTRLARGGIDEVAELKNRSGKDLLVMTSTGLGQSLMGIDLVDELHLIVHPSILGAGKALFNGHKPEALSLVKTTPFPKTGAVALHYAVRR